MKYVLDSNIAYKWEVPEPDSDKAIALREDYRQQVHELIAPEFFHLELAHAFAKAERQKKIADGEAFLFWTDAMTTAPILRDSLPIAPRALLIATQLRIGVYDCLYVALAETENCDLITADEKLIKNVQGTFPFVRHLSTL